MERYAGVNRGEVMTPLRLKELRTLGRQIARQVLTVKLGQAVDVQENFRVAGFSFKTTDRERLTVASFITVPEDEVMADAAGFYPLFRVRLAGSAKSPQVMVRGANGASIWRVQYPHQNRNFRQPEPAFEYLARIVKRAVTGNQYDEIDEQRREAVAGIHRALKALIAQQGLPWVVECPQADVLHVKPSAPGAKLPAFASVFVKHETDEVTGYHLLVRASVDPLGPKIALRTRTAADGTPQYRVSVVDRAKRFDNLQRAYVQVAQAIATMVAPVYKQPPDDTEVWEDG